MKYSSTLARLKVIKIDKNLQNLTKISYLANSFALETFRDKYFINEIEERYLKRKKRKILQHIQKQNQKLKCYLPHVFHILLLLNNLDPGVKIHV